MCLCVGHGKLYGGTLATTRASTLSWVRHAIDQFLYAEGSRLIQVELVRQLQQRRCCHRPATSTSALILDACACQVSPVRLFSKLTSVGLHMIAKEGCSARIASTVVDSAKELLQLLRCLVCEMIQAGCPQSKRILVLLLYLLIALLKESSSHGIFMRPRRVVSSIFSKVFLKRGDCCRAYEHCRNTRYKESVKEGNVREWHVQLELHLCAKGSVRRCAALCSLN
mmetsp:Transcript_20137/g.36447  ORF Transcript_20137/g.36447 Transcript_20137/m.36447 type:complete len:225 (+) Transcript_20137:653-1327(+)